MFEYYKELEPKFENKKSYYHKAIIEKEQNTNNYLLTSYNTVVCAVIDNTIYLYNLHMHTQTTKRHIVEFLKQFWAEQVDFKYYNSLRKEALQEYLATL